MGRALILLLILGLWGLCGAWAQNDKKLESSSALRSCSVDRVRNLMVEDNVVWSGGRKGTSEGRSGQSAKGVLAETYQAEDPETRRRGLEGLILTAPDQNIDAIVTALSDGDAEVRELAGRGLLKCDRKQVLDRVLAVICGGAPAALPGVDAALPALKDTLEDSLIGVLEAPGEAAWRKNGAGYCLGRMKSSISIPLLADGATSADPIAALTFVNALFAIQDPLVVPHLEQLAGHPLPDIRRRVVQGLADVGGPEALCALGRIAAVPPVGDGAISRKAALLLGGMGNPAVVPMLVEALQKNPAVQHAAISALRQIAKEDYGDDAEEWLKWYARQQGRGPAAEGDDPDGASSVTGGEGVEGGKQKEGDAGGAEEPKDKRNAVHRLWDNLKPKSKKPELPKPRKIHIEGSMM